MIKTGQIRRNGLAYGIRSIGDGIDIVTPHNEFLEEGVSSLSEAIKLVEADSLNAKYDDLRNKYMSDDVFWPK
jgi:hypothetical protein